MKYDVITIGSATYDVFLTSGGIHTTNTELGRSECVAYGAKVEVEDLFFGIGGGAVNTAATFSSLQLTVAPVARIGDDVPGNMYLINCSSKVLVPNILLLIIKNIPDIQLFLCLRPVTVRS